MKSNGKWRSVNKIKTNASGRKIGQLERVVFASCVRQILNLVNWPSTPRSRIRSTSLSSTVSQFQVNARKITKPVTS